MSIRFPTFLLGMLAAAAASPGIARPAEDGRLIAGTTLSHQVAILDQQPEGSYLLLPPVSWKSVEDFADMLTPEIEEAVAAKARDFQDQTGIRLIFVTTLNEATPITVQRARRMLSDQDPAVPLAIFIVQFSGIHNAAIVSPGLLAKIEPESMRALIGLASTRAAGKTSASERFNTFIAECLQLIRQQLGLPASTEALPPTEKRDPAKLAAAEFSSQLRATSPEEKARTTRRTEIHEFQPGDRSGRTPQIAKLSELSGAATPKPRPEPTMPVAPLSEPPRPAPKHVPDFFELLLYWICGILAVAAMLGLGIRFWLHSRARQAELRARERTGTDSQKREGTNAKTMRSARLATSLRRMKPGDKGIKDAPISVKPRDNRASNGKRITFAPRSPNAPQLERFTQSAQLLQVVPPRLRLRLLKAMEKQLDRVQAELLAPNSSD